MSEKRIKVDIVSDVACPWCFVGKRRFEAAVEKWQGPEIDVEWHPFQLDPTMRAEGMTRDAYLTNKFGSVEAVRGMTDRLTEVGKTVGINFDFGDEWLAVNTLKLHQLLHVAREEGFGAQLKERFLSAYFEETKHLNKLDVLYDIAEEFGWDEEKVNAIIENKEIAQKVQSEMTYYQQRGVSGVPFFVINDKYGISGAQTTETFLETFRAVTAEENVV